MTGKLKNIRQALRWVYTKASDVRGGLWGACLSGTLRVAASLAFVWISKSLIDLATHGSADTSAMWWLAAVMVVLMLFELAMSLLMSYLCDKAEVKMKNRLRTDIYGHSLTADTSRRAARHTGDTMSRITEDTRVVSSTLCQNVPWIIVMVVQLVGAFAMLYWMSPVLSLCIVANMPVFLILSKTYVRVMRGITARMREAEADLQTAMQEGLQHSVIVKTMLCAGMLMRKMQQLQGRYHDLTMERTRFNLYSRAMVRAGFMVGYLVTFIWCVWHLHTGVITFGMMSAFLQLAARVQNPMSNLTRYLPSLAQAFASVDRLTEIEDEPLEPCDRQVSLPGTPGIRVRGLTFRYDDGTEDVISGLDYDFTPGSVTAIMGTTGIGKTTLVRLLMGLRRPVDGSIILYSGGESLEVGVDTRTNFAYVPQGNSLFYDSIRNNLLVADPDATDEDMTRALLMAQAGFVLELPEGLDTVCGERAARLSEGQAQRVAIARALLRKGSVLLLDEFDSSLDSATAHAIMQAMCSLTPRRTIIFITHRPEMLAYTDRTLTLASGQ